MAVVTASTTAFRLNKTSRASGTFSSNTVTPEGSVLDQTASSPQLKSDDKLDADIAEAIRLSLQDGFGSSMYSFGSPEPSNNTFDVPIRYTKARKSPTSRSRTSPKLGAGAGSSTQKEMTDLEFALQLSLVEDESRKENRGDGEEFPALSPSPGSKGKGKGKGRV